MTAPEQPSAPEPGVLSATADCTRLLPSFLARESVTILLASPLTGGIYTMGVLEGGGVLFLGAELAGASAVLATPHGALWVAAANSLLHFDNFTRTAGYRGRAEALYAPSSEFFTAALGVSDLVWTPPSTVTLASRKLSRIGTARPGLSLDVTWSPPNAGKLAPEDHCGLSGLAISEGRPSVASVFGLSPSREGWRDGFTYGGKIIDLASNEVVAKGLCLPRTPRWGADALYALNSGTAELVRVDLATGRFEPVCSFIGHPTALTLHGHTAVVAFSSQPEPGLPHPPPAERTFESKKIRPKDGLALVDLRSGDIFDHAIFSPPLDFSSVALIPGCKSAIALAATNPNFNNLFRVKTA